MSFLLKISPHNLKIGKEYIIDVKWNLTNNLRYDKHNTFTGIFKKIFYIKPRTYSFDSGLKLLLTPSRYELEFEINNNYQRISTSNTFYEIHKISLQQLSSLAYIHKLNLPNEIKKNICQYLFLSRLNLPFQKNISKKKY